MRVAACNWEVKHLDSKDEFFDRVGAVALKANSEGVELLVLPECIVLELASLFPDLSGPELISRLADEAEPFERLLAELAKELGGIVGGSHFQHAPGGKIRHVSRSVLNGITLDQPKNVMTQFELNDWSLQGGKGLFPSVFGQRRIGTLVCYDSEFPWAARTHAESGVELICVPAYTETRRGFQRVRWSCQARAIENQIFVIHASLIGSLGREPIPSTWGSSAVLCPSVAPFPEAAILAETGINTPGLAVADLDFEMLAASRNDDDVRNWHDRDAGDWTVYSQP